MKPRDLRQFDESLKIQGLGMFLAISCQLGQRLRTLIKAVGYVT